MNLLQIRTEALNHGFDQGQYAARCNQYINDAQSTIARRVDYYVDEGIQTITTISGTAGYAFPADFAKGRSLSNTASRENLQPVGLREIDNSSTLQGTPRFYAAEGQTIRLYPTPDGVYTLQFRYWSMPPTLVADTDVPTLPADYHNLLWTYAVAQMYKGDDDSTQGQFWDGEFAKGLAQFSADMKFPLELDTQVKGMWDQNPTLNAGGWSYYVG